MYTKKHINNFPLICTPSNTTLEPILHLYSVYRVLIITIRFNNYVALENQN